MDVKDKKWQRTGFDWACANGHTKIVEMLIATDVEFHFGTALSLAHNHGHSKIFMMLIKFGRANLSVMYP